MKSIENVIKELIAYEPNLDAKLNLLTEIGLTTQNDDVWNGCEEIRNELCSCEEEKREVHAPLQKESSETGIQSSTTSSDYGTDGAGLFT